MNIALLLTYMRVVLIPVFAVIYYLPFLWAHPVASVIFVIAALTDWLDGYLARRLGLTTKLGAFLDPVADKLLVAFALVLVVGANYLPYLALPAAIIVMREIAVSALREWMAEMGKRASVAVTYVAKIKTAFQMGALTILVAYAPGFSQGWLWFGVLGLIVAAILTLWTMVVYLRASFTEMLN